MTIAVRNVALDPEPPQASEVGQPSLKTFLALSDRNNVTAFFTEPQFIETGKAFARGPEWVVRAEEHLMVAASMHVVDKVFWISGDLISRCIDEHVRVFHHE